jgi:hypothetical protein
MFMASVIASAAVEEYYLWFPVCRIPDCRLFSKMFNTLLESGMLPSAHVEEQENILEMDQRSPFCTSQCFMNMCMVNIA